MLNFELHQPTQIVFGKNQWEKLPSYIQKYTKSKKILIAYGGGSIEKSGLLNLITGILNEYELVLFKGIEANPDFDTLMQAVDLIKNENIDFILAIGGGSVIDGVKFISGAVSYNGDPWDVLLRKENCIFTAAIPFGTILTLPATGSESNSGAVISRKSIQEKRTMGGPLFFPKFSFLDPTQVFTLDKRQVANGVIDAFVHVVEQYLTFPSANFLQERQAEAILSTLIEIGPKIIANNQDYVLAANLMWCANQALNGTLRVGVVTDWSTHMIAHELTALYGIDHAQTLAIILPSLLREKFENKREKLDQYGERVWKLTASSKRAEYAIDETISFFESLGVSCKLSDYTSDYQNAETKIANRFEERNWLNLGERQDLSIQEIRSIIKNCI